MSPVSRGRKNKKREPERAEPREELDPDHPAVREMLDNVVAALADFERVDDPLDGEYLAASLLAVGYGTGPEGTETFARLFIAEAENFAAPGGLAFLRCVAALTDDPIAGLATEAAEHLAAQGVSAPAWVDELAEPTTAGEYFRWSEDDGAGAVLYGSFHRAGRTDGFLLFVDDSDCGSANDLAPFVSAEALAEARRMTNEEESASESPMAPEEFRWLVESALDVRESHDREVIELGIEPPQPEEDDIPYEVTDVVLRARLRALPTLPKPAPVHAHPG
ncbi:hypothetical protein ACFYTQ_19985 [Nocardia sp. NPDC004068]|uniref:hypothetical protein n=1 Tax=Nocardia sp. NPDC004068 TaxID=3364303 RepID=UPI0036C41386